MQMCEGSGYSLAVHLTGRRQRGLGTKRPQKTWKFSVILKGCPSVLTSCIFMRLGDSKNNFVLFGPLHEVFAAKRYGTKAYAQRKLTNSFYCKLDQKNLFQVDL